MNIIKSLKPIHKMQYELKEKHENRYFDYLKKRYGIKRANNFIHAG